MIVWLSRLLLKVYYLFNLSCRLLLHLAIRKFKINCADLEAKKIKKKLFVSSYLSTYGSLYFTDYTRHSTLPPPPNSIAFCQGISPFDFHTRFNVTKIIFLLKLSHLSLHKEMLFVISRPNNGEKNNAFSQFFCCINNYLSCSSRIRIC